MESCLYLCMFNDCLSYAVAALGAVLYLFLLGPRSMECVLQQHILCIILSMVYHYMWNSLIYKWLCILCSVFTIDLM